ncbi:MAG: ECF transporter S component [Lachnospiraceae bacterium]|nr:ECF transporter S component [Lachnospiraceae bacterium]
MEQNQDPVRALVQTAMLAALTCVATMILQVPSPVSGYVNLGDAMVILSAVFLGPLRGALAAGAGSALADLLLSYAHYAPGTLIIKGLAALAAGLIFRAFPHHSKKTLAVLLAGAGSLVIVVCGYFLYASIFLGKGAAAVTAIPGNVIQGALGIVISSLLYPLLRKMLSQPGL